ncbi:MAG: TerB N-terminal domain-containing protein [Clostridia bacterium]|nr:TerB N-terminal domain-containing protein [Clostridia bacterium]
MPKDNQPISAEDMQKREDAQDAFWDVSRLVPISPKPSKYIPPSPRTAPEAVEIDVPPVTQSPKEAEPKGRAAIRTVLLPPTGSAPLSFSHEEKQVLPDADISQAQEEHPPKPREMPETRFLYSYEPESPLFHKVDVYAWHSNFHYFDQFIKDAERYAEQEGTEVRPEPFFSYFPQYAQLNRRQRAWYFFWRSQVRREIYPTVDYSYILLYLFELLNLPVEGEEAAYRRDQIAKVWMSYRKVYPQLDHYACEWLCDYCLIHKLQAPIIELLPALQQIIELARLKEFYLAAMISVVDGKVNVASAKILLSHSCQYDYRKSKFYTGEHKALFDTVIPGAVAAVFPMLLERRDDPRGIRAMQPSTVSRDAYVGALCAYQNKRRIEITYTSFSRSNDLRYMIGDMVRHIENRIRASLLIRSRLTENFLTPAMRKALDTWLDQHLPSHEQAVKKAELNQPRPAYEALYDLPRKAVSLEDAAAIEADSWETTRILVEAFEGEGNQEKPTENVPTVEQVSTTEPPDAPVVSVDPTPVSVPSRDANESTAPAADSPLAPYASFIKAALDCDSAAIRAAAKALGKMPDALADEINALTADGEIGDIILEDDGMGGYTVIEDYRDAVLEMIDWE